MNFPGVQQQWQEFIAACDPRGKFSAIQRREMYRAFLGGFYSMLTTCVQIAEIDSEDAGAAMLSQIKDECERLSKELIRGDYSRIAPTN